MGGSSSRRREVNFQMATLVGPSSFAPGDQKKVAMIPRPMSKEMYHGRIISPRFSISSPGLARQDRTKSPLRRAQQSGWQCRSRSTPRGAGFPFQKKLTFGPSWTGGVGGVVGLVVGFVVGVADGSTLGSVVGETV